MSRSVASASEPFGLRLYRAISRFAGPVADLALKRRLRDGKEDPARIEERRGVAGQARPDGTLIWIHGASVGESLSVLPLVRRLQSLRRDLRFLVTTGTVTSAQLMAERLPEGAVHQYIPLDHPQYVSAFLDHWRPQAALFVESEFWPNLILAARERVNFMALINGRVSPRSYEDWSRRPHTIRYVLSTFDLIIAQDGHNAERLSALSGRDVASFGNLKNAAPPLPGESAELERLRREIREREVAEIASGLGLEAQLRSQNLPIERRADIYIADTLGELGLFYRLSDISFVGGSLTAKGGHNPLEPARLGGAVLHGPYTFNFVETYAEMRAAGGAALVRNERELATAVRRLLTDEKTRSAMASGRSRRALLPRRLRPPRSPMTQPSVSPARMRAPFERPFPSSVSAMRRSAASARRR
jgi:3-deoxy-D-manno-octulosonic-acid transferase